jgi:hypothetical protein
LEDLEIAKKAIELNPTQEVVKLGSLADTPSDGQDNLTSFLLEDFN